MRSDNLIFCLAASLMIGRAESILQAQGTDLAGSGRPATNRLAQTGFGRFAEGFGPLAGILNEEQRASFVQGMQQQGEKLRTLERQIRDARKDLLIIGVDSKFDENAARKQALVVANLEAEIAVLRIKALSQVQPPLSPDQIAQIKNAAPASPSPGARPMERSGRRRILSSAERDENDLPPKK
jgi:hypothetical protein